MADPKSKSVYDTSGGRAEEEKIEYYPIPDENGEVSEEISDVPVTTRRKLTQHMSEWSNGKSGHSVVKDKYPRDQSDTVEQLEENEFNVTTKYDPVAKRIITAKLKSSNKAQFDSEFRNRDYGLNNANKPVIDPQDFTNQETVEGIRDEYISTILKSNRWTADSTHVNDGSVSIPRSLKEKGENSIVQSSEEDRYNENQYTSIGPTLAARASIEKGSGEDGYDVNSAASEIWGMLPGWAQLAVKRPGVARFDAKDVLEKSSASEPDWISINDKSWGTMNSPIDKYSGNTAVGMTALAIALILGMLIGIELLTTILGMMHDDDDETRVTHGVMNSKGNKSHTTQIYDLGRFKASATKVSQGFPPLPIDLTAYLGMIKTTNSWEKSVRKGMLLFFGSDAEPGGFGSAALGAITGGDAFKAAAESPGFYIVFIRSVVRSSLIIFDQIKSAFSSLFSGSIFDGVKQMLELFEIIRRSKLMAALNLFAQLGDNALDEDPDMEQSVWDGKKSYSYVDSIRNDSARAAIMKSRLKKEGNSSFSSYTNSSVLAWGAGQAGRIDKDGNVAGTTLLVPQVLYNSATELGSSDHWLGSYSTLADGDVKSKMKLVSLERNTGNRIPTDVVEKLENALDGTYVPFYFHDIRTNELIVFHAFLTALSDQFSPDWNKASGFGRVDPVYTYKSTERKISLGFVVAATSEKDFKDMWIKINKLVTLVYPQYTEGTRLKADDDETSFIQPFSQMYSASPLIRIRLGDLLRSNYSKFALARLFGLGSDQEDFKVKVDDGENVELKVDDYAGIETTIQDRINDLRNKKDYQGKTYLIPASLADDIVFMKKSNGEETDASFDNEKSRVISSGKSFKVKIDGFTDTGLGTIADITLTDDNDDSLKGVSAIAPLSIIRVDHNELISAVKQEKLSALSELFSPEKNVIVKSFKSTGGRGLAGVINDLSLDFFENVTWETNNEKGKNAGIGSQAPKLCRITISFSPIHDIAPGIDFMGYNRAPVYPVGHPYPRGDNDPKKGSS